MAIKILDDALITKIAAGEVIERPASIVKELIENSIDAGATQISIELENSGKKFIKITDNGSGMTKEDVKLACVRHATSKISSLKDLFEIRTMGFRGEALASVSAVSETSIVTKTKNDVAGYLINYSFGNEVEQKTSASNVGTTITVKNLFSKLPVRLKFLKDDNVELRYIMSIITKIALVNENISFSVKNNNETLLNTQGNGLKNAITEILGVNIIRDMISVNDEFVSGFISKPELSRADKSNQFIYINKRPIENKVIADAIYDAYHTLLFLERQPIVVLNIQIDPKEVDVNVHPTKKEVRFENASKVYNIVFNAIKNTLSNNNLTANIYSESQTKLGVPKEEIKNINAIRESDSRYSGFLQKELAISQSDVNKSSDNSNVTKNNDDKNETHTEEEIDDFFVIGQIHKTFIFCETKEGITIYDQHATQERINYEKFISQADNIKKQTLLEPKILELNPKEMRLVEERLYDINAMGFLVELFGTNTIIVREIPLMFMRQHDAKILYDIINTFESAKNKTMEDLKHNIAATMACRASIKAGDVLTKSEMVELIREYKKCKLPYTCPHGRPAQINLSSLELEKLFKRIA
ncbi:MAG: DNA mismatch repair endonuclease MutL [Candidatus Woesearchaeota archaeon]|jgi:DNA mismatch repair protein MutL